VNRNIGYITRHVNYFVGKPGHAFALVFEHKIVHVTDRQHCLELVGREDLVGLVTWTPKTQWGGIVPLLGDADGASYVAGEHATIEEAVEAVRTRARELRAEYERVLADPAYALETLLKSHDWFAHNSDDYGVCAASDRHWDMIQALRAKVAPEVYEALLAKYQPKVK
jgi:hypothetical protein